MTETSTAKGPASQALLADGRAVSEIGIGTAALGGLFEAVDEECAMRTLTRAYDLGLRTFDTAPLYGFGLSERRLGRSLADGRRDDCVVSTKVGRLIRTSARPDPSQREMWDEVPEDTGCIFDYSASGTLASIEESLDRLGFDRVDIVFIHDPDDHYDAAIGGAYPTLHKLRADGVVSSIGVGMNQTKMLTRFARDGDFDCFLVAGRYTLLDQSALDELLPTCVEKGISIVIGGVYNSGILAGSGTRATFDYQPAQAEIVARAQALEDVCTRHQVPLKAAALQFPLAHPAVRTVLVGPRSPEELDENLAMASFPIPADLWAELRHERLLPEHAPVPAPSGVTRPGSTRA